MSADRATPPVGGAPACHLGDSRRASVERLAGLPAASSWHTCWHTWALALDKPLICKGVSWDEPAYAHLLGRLWGTLGGTTGHARGCGLLSRSRALLNPSVFFAVGT